MAFVTIGIPAYNQPEYICQAVESALNQSYPELEVIVSDDSTNDLTEKACAQYFNHPNFRYVHNTPALGRVANYRHLLYDLATSPFFLCLDGDDYLVDEKYIERAVRDLLDDSDKVLVFANNITYFQEHGVKIYDQNNGRVPNTCDGDWFFINFCHGFGLAHQTVLYNRQEAMKLDFYRHDVASADWESFLRLVQGHKIGHQPQAVSVWRKHGSNETRRITLQSILNNRIYMQTPLKMARERQAFTPHALDLWRDTMLTRYYVKSLLRLIFTHQPQAVKALKNIIRQEERPGLRFKIFAHPLVLLASIIPPGWKIWRFIFKKLLKMESFYYEFSELQS